MFRPGQFLGASLMLFSHLSTELTDIVLQAQLPGEDGDPSLVFQSTQFPRQIVPRTLQPDLGLC